MSYIEKTFGLKDKVIIVTGGNTGLGMEYVYRLASAGAKIYVFSYDQANVEKMKSDFEKEKWSLEFGFGDLTKFSDVQKCITGCIAKYKKIDVLVNNAGSISRTPILEGTNDEFDRIMNINLTSVYQLSREVCKEFKKQGSGKIINIASMLSFQGGKFVPSYAASKHGVAGLTKAFANELAEFNIQVNAIAPGYIETANTEPIRADKKRNAEILSRIPAGKWGVTSDVADACIFLSSAGSNYINGHILAVDGGWLAR